MHCHFFPFHLQTSCTTTDGNNTLNEVIINELQKLAEAYRVKGDRWRTLAYDKAVISLKSLKKPITSMNVRVKIRKIPKYMLEYFSISKLLTSLPGFEAAAKC